ncbi:MAG TPA: polysaccharide deacetylase family protein [Chthoniobacterales bacterium]|jgi:peptidoglycan/xylan/chitin deacetylase (PgdA/CDA1 family)|nr:polysaccharide deacetylase family protein [Chthoniobacterales bacterium]
MRTRFFSLTCLFAILACSLAFAAKPTPAPKAPAAAPSATPAPTVSKPVVDQTAQTIIFCYHRLVDKVRYPGTEITPAMFEQQMKMLKDRGITVISLQDLLAWKRGEKNIPPRCAVITFDDGWKSQYEVAWPILKKMGYPLTLFLYTEGIAGASLGGGQACTWEMLGDMRDNGVDIEAHSATHQDLREGHTVMIVEPDRKRTKKKLTGAEYEQWVQNEVVGCKTLLEQRLAIKINSFAVPFGNYNEHVKELARNAGYEAMFTVYGQPITWTSPMDALGRYAIEANKPKVFEDAVKLIASSSGGPGGPAVAEVGAANLQTEPADGSTVRNALPLIKANLSQVGQIDPASVQMRISGLGLVPATFDAKTGIVSYQVTQRLRDKTCTVILSAKSGDKKVETHWTFGIEAGGAGVQTAPSATPKK